MKNGIVIALALLLLVGPAATGQNDDGILALSIDNGVVLVWNQPNDHFTLEIHGKHIVPMPDGEHVVFGVDGVVLQVKSVPVSAFLNDPPISGALRVLLGTSADL